jgi:DNA-binding MarR family transcriptional regulator
MSEINPKKMNMEKKSVDSIMHSRLLIGRARHALVRVRQRELAPYHVSPQQASVLTMIDDLGDKANLNELAKRASRSLNTISIQLTRMEKVGLVKKTRVTPRSNQLKLELTEKGVNICKYAKKIKSIRAIMSILTEEERLQLISLLGKIVKETEKYEQSLGKTQNTR